MTLLIAVALYLLLVALILLFNRGAHRKRTPAPPAGPRMRLVRSRERVGVVRVLPDRRES